MDTILTVLQVLIALAMSAIILIQRGSGAAAGSGFGAGASGTVFGSRGSSSFLSRTTAVLATLFFVISMTMGVIASRNTDMEAVDDLGVMAGSVAEEVVEPSDVPAAPAMQSSQADDVPTIDAGAAAAEEESVPAATEDDGSEQ